MKKPLFLILILVIGAALSGCSSESEEEAHIDHVNGDIREETASVTTLPSFMDEKPQEMHDIYMAAAQSKELLENIPCYCGCGESVGHRDNYDCFVNKTNEDGSIIWDDHGTKCGVCMEIAAQSIIDYQDGKSIKEIREKIDSTYENGYAEPTPTPAL